MHKCRQHHSQRHPVDRLSSQTDGLFALFSCQSSAEPQRYPSGRLSRGIQHGRDEQGQDDLGKQHPETADLFGYPSHNARQVWRQARRQFLTTQVGDLLPLRRRFRTDQRNHSQPVWRGWQLERGERGRPSTNLLEILQEGADGKGERQQEDRHQKQRHHRYGEPPFTQQPALEHQEQGPGGDHDHGRPHDCGEKRQEDPDRGRDQREQEHDRECVAGQIKLPFCHRDPLCTRSLPCRRCTTRDT
ncbi:MAG: hypothetical protein JW395_3649 [Nitrospira sp.]|nr:hypothetical protein [Nitrospira sp.]